MSKNDPKTSGQNAGNNQSVGKNVPAGKAMPAGKTEQGAQAEQTAETERIQRWRWMLEQDVPIIGGWMHRRIASALTESALSGNWLAAQSLAVVFVFHDEADVRRMAGQTLRKINYATGIDAVWGVWAETRNPGLEEIVLEYNRLANHPASVRLLSALRTSLEKPDALQAITRGSPDLAQPLIQACDDVDNRIVRQAHQAILQLRSSDSIDVVCRAWQTSRSPFLAGVLQQAGYVAQKPADTRVLSALKINQITHVLHSSAEMVAPLIAACQDVDAEIVARAGYCLPQLQEQAAVDEFCRLWSETRDPLLEKALLQANYVARSTPRVRLLAALKTGQMTIAEKASAQGLPVLLEATQDRSKTIRKNARAALDHLREPETIEALCSQVIEKDDPLAREIALSAGYAPQAAEVRALFYFLTEQWQKYDELDFDQSMMRAIYEASPADLRQRIAARVQKAGRTDYLTILAGVDYRARAEAVNASEAALMIRVLAENREYKRLWALLPELAPPFCVEILRILSTNGWRPDADAPGGEIDQPVFDELVRLSEQPMLLNGPELSRSLPLAIQRATVKVKGRINEVAFSPNQPVLAIATSQRKVALWNFQTASIERVLSNFQHSVGKVSYTPAGLLLCAERTNNQTLCSVFAYTKDESFQLTAHEGSVTVLEPVGDNLLLTAGRDSRAFLWDLDKKKKIADRKSAFWARSAAISPDRQYAALLHDRLSLARLPDLSLVPGFPFLVPRAAGFKHGVAQNAAFSPDGKYLLAGQYNGQVALYFHTSLTQRPRQAVITQHSEAVRGIHFLPGHPIVITAGAEGQVRFIRWPEAKSLGMVFAPDGPLTSLRVSQNGAFMATGTSEASLILWDLRVLDIPDLFSQPLATASHDQVSTVMALSEYLSLPEPVRNGLKFLRTLLQYRFRFDIQVEEAPIIQFGEFDILLEEAQPAGGGPGGTDEAE